MVAALSPYILEKVGVSIGVGTKIPSITFRPVGVACAWYICTLIRGSMSSGQGRHHMAPCCYVQILLTLRVGWLRLSIQTGGSCM